MLTKCHTEEPLEAQKWPHVSLLKVTQWPPAALHTKLHSTGMSSLPNPISSHSVLLNTGFLPSLKQNKLFLSPSLCTYRSFWLKIWSIPRGSHFCLDLNGLSWTTCPLPFIFCLFLIYNWVLVISSLVFLRVDKDTFICLLCIVYSSLDSPLHERRKDTLFTVIYPEPRVVSATEQELSYMWLLPAGRPNKIHSYL